MDWAPLGYSRVQAHTDWDHAKIDLKGKKIIYPWPLQAGSTVQQELHEQQQRRERQRHGVSLQEHSVVICSDGVISAPGIVVRSADVPPPTYEQAIEPPSYDEVQTGKLSTIVLPTPRIDQFWGETV